MLFRSQLICRQQVMIRASSEVAFSATCMGMAAAKGKTAELAASVRWTPPVANAAFTAEAAKHPMAMTITSKSMSRSLDLPADRRYHDLGTGDSGTGRSGSFWAAMA